MHNRLLFYWSLSELAGLYLLWEGLYRWDQIVGFLAAHGLSMALALAVCISLVSTDARLRDRVVNRHFLVILGAVGLVPVVGPVTVLIWGTFLRSYPIYPVRKEAFDVVDANVLGEIRQYFQVRAIPVAEALLIGTASREVAMRMVSVLEEMDWSDRKANVLKYVVKLSPHQNVVLMAIDALTQRLDGILRELAAEEAKEAPDALRVARLYHEICYLDLCDPAMRQEYLAKACDWALRAYREEETEENALHAVKYLLRLNRVEEAEAIYHQTRERGRYFLPHWISFELELALKKRDWQTFENLTFLIEQGSGVFISERIKKAARAWERVRTSAWL
ncbi:hypothetical protein SAMN02746041_00818 [Desulfacinum hydrothermale DSM 13146]|uniref:Uncharacterized protein n=1 Tax=Desulfacinum hydrothermale DSM 13146 TaxID=1121390 RepID=A0A1W1X864_9BACT|nr:hypothetical protein [Desulfacinum hydrothermale]SMC20109.1 hypothetical protein SAMN02746041_00818 [Desulfacinum hydrothermale DSM 13146]